jgi:hypothetical protein
MDPTLIDEISEHIRQVDLRTARGDGTYSHERDEIRLAADLVEVLHRRLGLGTFLRSLSPGTGRPQLLLLFESDHHGPVVLKVYGRRRPNEAAVQRLWADAGISTIPIIQSGDDPSSWLLMPFIKASRVGGVDTSTEDWLRLGHDLARVIAVAHRTFSASIVEPLQLCDGIGRHLEGAVRALERHGYRPPDGWRMKAQQFHTSGSPTLLHGDLTPVNLMRKRTGQLVFFDTCGYTGPAEFDAARWCARVGGSIGSFPALHEWCCVETGLDRELAEQLLGLELLMEAGVRELRKEELGRPWESPDRETRDLLHVCTEFISDNS